MRSKFQKEFRQLFSILPEAGKLFLSSQDGAAWSPAATYVVSFTVVLVLLVSSLRDLATQL